MLKFLTLAQSLPPQHNNGESIEIDCDIAGLKVRVVITRSLTTLHLGFSGVQCVAKVDKFR